MAIAPIDTSISARTLHDNMVFLLDEVDRLRLVQQPGRPETKPAWWNEHIHSTDLEWPAHRRKNCRADRTLFRHRRVEQRVGGLVKSFERLTAGIELTPATQAAFRDAHNALEAMQGMLSGAQSCARLYWAVIPDQLQLARSIPRVYTPVLPSEHERWIEDKIDEIAYLYAVGQGDWDQSKRLVRQLQRRARRLREERVQQNRRLLQTEVTQQQHDRIVALLDDWREIVRRWELAEQAVRRAVRILGSGFQTAAFSDAAQLNPSLPLNESLHRIVAAAVAEAVRTIRAAPGPATADAGAGRYQICKRGSCWVLKYDGTEVILKSGTGMAILQQTVRFPGKHFTYADLSAVVTPREVLVSSAGDAAIDQEAAKQYQDELNDIEASLEAAIDNDDQAAIDRLTREKAELAAHLRAATWRGAIRKEVPDYERTRKRVVMAVHRTIQEIAADLPAAADHFDKSVKKDGGLIYRPDVEIPWEF